MIDTLRLASDDELSLVCRWINTQTVFYDWCAGKYQSFPVKSSDIIRFNKSTDAVSVIADDENGIPIGHFSVRFIDAEKQVARIGFVILAPEMRGKGLAKQLIKKAICYAKINTNAKTITICCYDDNIPALRTYERVGFVKNGRYELIDADCKQKKYFELELKSHN